MRSDGAKPSSHDRPFRQFLYPVSLASFTQIFRALTGTLPFPWQEALFKQFAEGRIPAAASIPTGLGKTAVVAIWLIALALHPDKVPRRLVYVVNRRTVVDQTTGEVEKWRKKLREAGLDDALRALIAVPLRDDQSPLAISTLRGQFADNRDWSADPARPAIVVGTVDMIGSRLLFSGYGCGFKVRPLQAAFLGQDALLVHDEAHLEPAFQELLSTIVQRQTRDLDARPLRLLQLSATTRGNTPAFGLTEADKLHSGVARRLHAAKSLRLHPVADEKLLAERLAALALARRDSGRAVLIFARSVEVVQRVSAELLKQKIEPKPQILTGTLRGLERDELVEHSVFQRFLPPSSRTEAADAVPAPGTVYLVATSAGEVGVNLSADDLVCDLSTFESVAQRFGRVNRFGERTDSEIDLVHPEGFDLEDPIDSARARTLDLLRQLQGDASPHALGHLDPEARALAFSPPPKTKPATDILFDAWSLTTIRERLPGRPPVAPYLHGVSEWEPPETYVAWRTEVQIIDEALRLFYDPAELLADYPLKPHELLRDRSSRVHKQLMKLAERAGDQSLGVWLLNDDGTVERKQLADFADKDAEESLHDRTLILPPAAGGLSEGWLDGSAEPSPDGSEDVSDRCSDAEGKPLRRRLRSDDPKPPRRDEADNRFRLIRTIDTRRSAEESDETEASPDSHEGRFWHWLEAQRATESDRLQQAGKSVTLPVHTKDVELHAATIARQLGLPTRLQHILTLAARFHDRGKARLSWQRGIGNPHPETPLAKAGSDLRIREVGDRYRHEFGSLHDAAAAAECQALTDEERDLLLHLIAAHHGRARPHFPVEETVDPAASYLITREIAAEVPRRFARLQSRHGRWGLAYLESLIRAADYAASANPSSTMEVVS